jgi:endonuclease YncB( thermonuclease family)
VRWRLMGFDTPETYEARCEREYRLGIAATEALQRMIAVAKKVEPVTDGRLDRYGRVLGHLYLDGKEVGAILIEKRLAVAYDGRGPRRNWCNGALLR